MLRNEEWDRMLGNAKYYQIKSNAINSYSGQYDWHISKEQNSKSVESLCGTPIRGEKPKHEKIKEEDFYKLFIFQRYYHTLITCKKCKLLQLRKEEES